MGKIAAERLIDLIEHPETAIRKPAVYPVELVEGGTVAEIPTAPPIYPVGLVEGKTVAEISTDSSR